MQQWKSGRLHIDYGSLSEQSSSPEASREAFERQLKFKPLPRKALIEANNLLVPATVPPPLSDREKLSRDGMPFVSRHRWCEVRKTGEIASLEEEDSLSQPEGCSPCLSAAFETSHGVHCSATLGDESEQTGRGSFGGRLSVLVVLACSSAHKVAEKGVAMLQQDLQQQSDLNSRPAPFASSGPQRRNAREKSEVLGVSEQMRRGEEGPQTRRPPLETVGPKMSQVAMNLSMFAMMNKNYCDAVNNVGGR
ncbi:hypothetical protein GUITHDRAFT_134774 [Guillardia theta CCMP2712]|uniref:Uncharacterized protein n=1 Tax=Guillardia theta (strain CCMP2712) TaxID=905079 RepID=L1JS89_GUITC|nr:hypothetical protein GUITHDRAFT_134774 [Guillardia theta CCMP2712]EKX51292.1 hypothetical protein GUITHDRAFT_134774 [Guillardia theta CCMP2712]|eukprot:XP_005838272.1 hypothetical protein GUITHDRAFT_134774 [Guillardia theta CCMP2712]